jgi:hypothetical protein
VQVLQRLLLTAQLRNPATAASREVGEYGLYRQVVFTIPFHVLHYRNLGLKLDYLKLPEIIVVPTYFLAVL